MSVGREPEPFPLEQIRRLSKCDSWTSRRKCRVGHDVALKRLNIGHAWIFAATAAIRPAFVIGFRFERDANPLYADRIAGIIKSHTRDADAGVISFCHQPREEIERSIRTTSGCRVKNAFDFVGIAGLRFHHHPEAP